MAEEIYKKLPLTYINKLLPIPNNEIRLEVVDKETKSVIQESIHYRNYFLILVPKDHLQVGVISSRLNGNESDQFKEYLATCSSEEFNQIFSSTAVLAKVILNVSAPGGIARIKIQTQQRVKLKSVDFVDGFLVGNYCEESSYSENSEYDYAYLRTIKESYSLLRTNDPEFIDNIINEKGLDVGSDRIAEFACKNILDAIEIVEAFNVTHRLKTIAIMFQRQKLFSNLDRKIEDDIKKSINESQKEYYLREKIKAIQEELGDKAKRDSDIEQLRDSIKEKQLPDRVREIALKELNRYATTPANSAENGIIRTYLDFLLSLPWGKYSNDTIDIALAAKELDREHYGMTKVKNRILEYLAVKVMTGKNPQTILCLVGPPGVGKTSLVHSIASCLNRSFVKQALGGVHDESEIRGHRRTYIGALPGRILQGMAKSGTNNPVFLLDEIDKLSSDYKGDPTSALLEVLDPEQNRYFSDHYLEEPYDLSQVLFVCTANYLENIAPPLRDRLEIVELSSYTEYEKYEIARRHLVKKQLARHGLDESLFSISDQSIYLIIQEYTREAGVRELERHLGAIIRKSVKQILMDKLERIDITVENLGEFLGKPRYVKNNREEIDQVGVVTGLAYTQYGGDTLPVEVTYYPGKGSLVLTGHLGEVMKESAQAALSYVKSTTNLYQIDPELFVKNDIHIHVPEGAVPKDGPSAGITMATAIISALTARKVNHLIGMTGEINLRGKVMPIGGLREKSIAAHRCGLKTILIPQENVRDLDEIPDSVKNSLNIIPVSSIEEVISHVIKS